MSTSLIQDRSTHDTCEYTPLLNFYHFPSTVISKEQRVGPKGGPVERFVASVEIVDLQDEVIRIEALAKEMDTLMEIGGLFQGLHSNYPAGHVIDWGFCKVEGELGIWTDVEFYQKYDSQKEFYRRVKLPWGHPDKIGGVSLGGKSLEEERVCDDNGCVNHITKLEAWELSGVKKPANHWARRIKEDGTLEGLGYKVQFLGKDTFTQDNSKEEILISTTKSQPRDPVTGQWISKGCGCGCNNGCISKMECPDCGNKMEGMTCKGCGYKKMDDEDRKPDKEEPKKKKKPKSDKDEDYDEEEGEVPEDTSPDDDDDEEKMDKEPSNNATYPEEDPRESEEDMTDQKLQTIEQKIDTTMEALNIQKGETDELKKMFMAFMKANTPEPEPPKEIEHEGKTYILKEDDSEEPESEVSETEKELTKQFNALLKNVEKLTGEDLSRQIADQHVDDNLSADDGEFNKSKDENQDLFDFNNAIMKNAQQSVTGNHFNAVNNPNMYYRPTANIDDIELNERMRLAKSATMQPLEDMGIIQQR